MGETRKIVAILAADVVGFSRLTSADEDRTLARLRALRSDLVDPTIAVHHGRVIKRTGDGALVEFRSVVDAVRCAIEVQNGMVERNAGLPPDRRIDYRIGVHLGDVVEEGDGDLMGDGVNIAARLEGIAKPGSIYLSEDAYRQVKARLNVAVNDLGATQLKNISEPIRVYSLQVGAETQPRPTTQSDSAELGKRSEPLALPDKPSIAVLPFQNMSGDPEQEYFADGMVEDIITGLSRIKWLFVIARNSTFTYKGRAVDVKQVSRELGVRYVLEGSVRKAGNRVRITTQLIDGSNGHHVWAERYDQALDDIFALQDEIAMSVVGTIEPSLRKAEIDRVKRLRPSNLNAYDLVLRSLPHVFSNMPTEAATAIPMLEDALKLEPNYSAAHAFLSWCLHARFARGGLREEDRIAATRHARAATNLDNDDATALAVAAQVIAFTERDTNTAFKVFDRALELSSSNVFALSCSAVILAWMGKAEIAIERAQQALRLSPRDSFNFRSHHALAIAHFQAQRYGDAAEAANGAINSNPNFSPARAVLAGAFMRLGRVEEAKVAARAVLECQPSFTIRAISIVTNFNTAVFEPLADALREVGLPS